MPIIGAIIAIVGFIAVWYWRMQVLKDAARDGRKVVETVVNLPRKIAFKRRTGKGGLQVVDDPREAATILMLEIAQARGPLSEASEAAIRAEIMQHFEFDEADADGLISQAGWLSRDAGAPHTIVARMTDFVMNSAGMSQKDLRDLENMLLNVADAGGGTIAEQEDLLAVFRQKAF